MITFRALGAPDLRDADGNQLQSILARPKLLGLLTVLASGPPRVFHRRDTLLGFFWAETDQTRGRRALRQSLYYLRQSLGEGVLTGRGEEEIGLDTERFWCDVWAFNEALQRDDLEQALELYRGELLTGFFVSGAPVFERWLDEWREETRRRACSAAWELAARAGREGNAAAAGHWARRATALAPFDEALAMRAMALLDSVGDRSGAVRLYEAFARRLEEELELQPAPETRALIEEIRSRSQPNRQSTAVAESASSPAAAPDESLTPELEPAAPSSEPHRTEPVSRVPQVRPKSHSAVFRLGALAAVCIAVGLGLVWALPREDASADPRRVFVAVLENRTGEADLDPLGHMAADWITQGLLESGLVEVVQSAGGPQPTPDFAATGFPDRGAVSELAEAAGAGTIVSGAYYRRGDFVELQVQVIDARDGRLLGAVAPVSGARGDPGSAIDSLRRSVVNTLAVLLEPSLARSTAAAHPPSLEAYREYLEGVRAFEQRQDNREALRYFYRALELDSTFVTPRVYVIFAHLSLGEGTAADSNARLLDAQRTRLTDYQRHTLDWQLALLHGDQTAALEAARARGGIDIGVQALKVNRPREAIAVLTDAAGLADFYFHWLALTEAYHMVGDYRRELREVRRVGEAYPDRLWVLDAELRSLAALGRIDEVQRSIEESLLLPIESGMTPALAIGDAAAELRAHGHREASLGAADRAIDWYTSRPAEEVGGWWYRYGLAIAYYQRERWEDARALFEGLASETPENVNVKGYLGVLAARRGDRQEALRLSEELGGLPAPDLGRDSYWQACIASLLGEREKAMVFLRRAFADGRQFSIRVHRDMDLEPLYDFPPFQLFMKPKG